MSVMYLAALYVKDLWDATVGLKGTCWFMYLGKAVELGSLSGGGYILRYKSIVITPCSFRDLITDSSLLQQIFVQSFLSFL